MDMRKSRVLRQMRSGKVATCVKLNLADTRAAEIAAMCGFDCVWLDMEHVPSDFSFIENAIRAAKIYDCDTLTRVPHGCYSDLVRPLEADSTGIMVPHLMSLEDAKRVVYYTKFHPIGRRPIDGGNTDGKFCLVDGNDYMKQANEERFDEINKCLSESSLQAIFYSSITNPATRFINSLVYAAVGLTGAFAAVAGSITVGGLSAFLSYANQYTKPFNEISGVITEFQNALVCAERIFALIEEPTEEPDASDACVLDHAEGIVQANAVAFSYVADRPLIKCLDLDVKSGERVAIVGPTGCGKTTLINLLMRFYDVNAGSISVEGTDIRNITRHSLRRNYGMVLQETWLKEGTIRDNIVMGKPDATEKEIIDAAKAAHSHGFITRLPKGYDTVIGEDGGSLSQGQKQLLCITRVMLCLPPMLILDEATSSIDTRTEQHIQHAFAQLMQGRTSFIVAHRLSTIKNADMILVMKDGDIIEKGKHDELVACGGFYAALYNSQFAR